MAQLWELLEIEKGLTAVMGSGGKTGLLYELAEELRPYGTVLLATTTHIMRPPQYPFAATAAELTSALTSHGAACAGSFTAEGKLTAPDFPGWETAADFGGGGRLKAPARQGPRDVGARPAAPTAADGVRAGCVRLRAGHPSSGSPPCAVRRFGGGDGGHGHHPGAGGPGADGRGQF